MKSIETLTREKTLIVFHMNNAFYNFSHCDTVGIAIKILSENIAEIRATKKRPAGAEHVTQTHPEMTAGGRKGSRDQHPTRPSHAERVE